MRWLVTGAAGFIGSHLVDALLRDGQSVVGLDNFATGHRRNLDEATRGGGDFTFIEGDVTDAAVCARACDGADFVLHQAALGSVPRSLERPLDTHRTNVDGFVTVLLAARDAKVKRFVYASSSSVYGDDAGLPKVEARTGRPLSPYAATKQVNELYAGVFERSYGLSTVGLRYFNVFGPRQDPLGPYAAVVPRWLHALRSQEDCVIFGDGSTSRDFCFVANVVQANLKAATAPGAGGVYNVALGAQTSLLELHAMLSERLGVSRAPIFKPFRPGDIKDSRASIALAVEKLGYAPTHTVAQGLDALVAL